MRPYLLIGIALSMCSCATIFNHPAQQVSLQPQFPSEFKAQPVRVLISGPLGTYRAALPTQFVISADTWTHVRVTVVEPCFKASEHALPRSITTWLWLDALGIPVGGGIFALAGDGLDGTLWSYDREVKVPVEPVDNFGACVAESRKTPGRPFPVSPYPAWVDPRTYPAP